MAVTYEDFEKRAKDAGMLERFSQYDLDTAKKNPEFGMSMLGFKTDYLNATTPEAQLLANEGANALRKKYGSYTGGGDGMEYNYMGSYGNKVDDMLGRAETQGSFAYSRDPDVDQLVGTIMNQKPFSYDAESDPTFSAYKKAYLREGDRATANALAQASAMTGGVPSSYAVAAAQQAGNYYAGQLADKVPELEQQAYGRYLDEFGRQLNTLGALQNDRAQEHSEWQGDFNNLMALLGGYQTQDQIEYGRQQDERNWQLTQQQFQNQLEQQEWDKMFAQAQFTQQQKQNLWDNAFALHKLGYATPEIASILGIPQSTGGDEGGSGLTWNPNRPWEWLGIKEEEYRALYGGGPDSGENDTGGNGLSEAQISEVHNYVNNLLDTSGSQAYRVAGSINGRNDWTDAQKAEAYDWINKRYAEEVK